KTSVVALHVGKFRPVGGRVLGQASTDRVNAEGKKLVELALEGLQSKSSLGEQIPIECFDMANVENDPVPLRDWTIVDRFVAHDGGGPVGGRARLKGTRMDVVANAGSAGKSSHWRLAFLWMRDSGEGCAKNADGANDCRMMVSPDRGSVNRNECETKLGFSRDCVFFRIFSQKR